MACGGVRNRIYESHCFGSTFSWDHDQLQPGSVQDVCLEPEIFILNGVVSGSARVTLEFYENPEGNGWIDYSRTRAGEIERSSSSFSISGITESNRIHFTGEARWTRDGQTLEIGVEQAQESFPQVGTSRPHIVAVTSEWEINSPKDRIPASELIKFVEQPELEWDICHATGVFEVRKRTISTDDPLQIQLIVANVDDRLSYFELSRVRLIETDASFDPPEVRMFKPEEAQGNVQHIELPVDYGDKGEVPIELTFREADRSKTLRLIYRRPSRIVELIPDDEIITGPGRPRIHPGG